MGGVLVMFHGVTLQEKHKGNKFQSSLLSIMVEIPIKASCMKKSPSCLA
jgi:hypothetical protein